MKIDGVDMDRVDELERALNKPMYVLKMARFNPQADANTRANNARIDIHILVMNYAKQRIDAEATLGFRHYMS